MAEPPPPAWPPQGSQPPLTQPAWPPATTAATPTPQWPNPAWPQPTWPQIPSMQVPMPAQPLAQPAAAAAHYEATAQAAAAQVAATQQQQQQLVMQAQLLQQQQHYAQQLQTLHHQAAMQQHALAWQQQRPPMVPPMARPTMAPPPQLGAMGIPLPRPPMRPVRAPAALGPTHLVGSNGVPAPRPRVIKQVADLFSEGAKSTRPRRFVVVLRGVPGSGKSRLAKQLRQAETSAGGLPPRVIALDDYFMIEDDDGEPVYQHEPEMEAAYRAEALKAFRKAAAEGKEQREPSRSARFNNAILIVDACNLRVSELLEWVHAAVGAGYSTFVASCAGDAAECAARNVHGWSAEKVAEMAEAYEPTPPNLALLDGSSEGAITLRGDEAPATSTSEPPPLPPDLPPPPPPDSPPPDSPPPDSGSAESAVALLSEPEGTALKMGSKWEEEEEEAEEGSEGVSEARVRVEGPPAPIGTVTGNVAALGGLLGQYNDRPKKRVRWADLEAEKDKKFGAEAGFTLHGLQPLKRERLRSPPPDAEPAARS